jgi:hypothetical protein
MKLDKEWKCKQCGICCKFIVIPVQENPGIEVLGYLAAHGIAFDNGRLIIPARCEYLQRIPGIPRKYNCMIHENKFSNCRLGGKKECKEAKRDYKCLLNLKS